MDTIEKPEDLSYKHGVPFVIWCYWEGEPMTGNRMLSFSYLIKNIGVPVCLITPENIHLFIKQGHPLPSAYQHLSIVHRSDYVRAYLLHHYGGGWHDIKATEVSYADAWDEFKDNSIWIVGKAETKKGAANAYDSQGRYMPDYYEKLIAVPSWIGRANTAFSEQLLLGIEHMINKYSDALSRYPSKHARDKKITAKSPIKRLFQMIKFIYQGRSTNYPLEWTLFGNIFHPCVLLYQSHVSRNLPEDTTKNAGIYHRG